jgi:Lon protease-like protein
MDPSADHDTIPIFPLPNVVLFPTLSVPLYIFEPRYRAMTHAVLEAHRRIGMVAIRPEALGDIAGDPAIFSVGCEGEIGQARERPDGTLDIVLVATHRFRILEEKARSETYRTARIEVLEEEEDSKPDAAPTAALRARIFETLCEIARRSGPEDDAETTRKRVASLSRLNAFSDAQFVHVVAQSTNLGVLDKQRLLEVSGAGPRYRLLDELLRFRLGELEIPIVPGSDLLQ